MTIHRQYVAKSNLLELEVILFRFDLYMIQSSANSLSEEEMLLSILLIYSKNIAGPKTVPCGIPDITLAYFDSYPCINNHSLCSNNLQHRDVKGIGR